ncbi:hypothetical protein [Streptomyces sp. NPDC041003]|uniref:hypothetical protein n=1 Tax=Streptomyces sp. NPDC041003 TaxID=3155730 RepID=UPI0033D7E58A
MIELEPHSFSTSGIKILDRALERALNLPEVASASTLLSDGARKTLWEELVKSRDEMLSRVGRERRRMQSVELGLRESEWAARQQFPPILGGDKDLETAASRFESRHGEIIAQAQEAGVDLSPLVLEMKPFQQLARETPGAPKRPEDPSQEISLSELVSQLRNEALSALSATSILEEEIWEDFIEPPGKEGSELALQFLLQGKLQRFYQHYLQFKIAVSRRERLIRCYLMLRLREPEYITGIAELESLSLSLEDSLLNDAVLPEFRRLLNESLTGRNVTRIRVEDAPGLHDPSPDTPTPTRAITRIQELMQSNMNGMSIGVAGPRGAGKTTAIEGFCTGRINSGGSEVRDELLGVKVSAPVAYDAREFILHLFSEVCRRVLELNGASDEVDEHELGGKSWAGVYLICGGFVGSALLAAGMVICALSLRTEFTDDSAIVMASGLTMLGAAALITLRRWPRKHSRGRLRFFKYRVRIRAASLQFEGALPAIDVLIVAGSGILASCVQLVDPREPAGYLLGCVALALSAVPLGINRAIHRDPEETRLVRNSLEGAKYPSWLSACLLWSFALLCSSGVAMVALSIWERRVSLATVIGCSLALFGWGILWILMGQSRHAPGISYNDIVSEGGLVIQARACLDAINFQRTFSMERSAIVRLAGTPKLPAGFESQFKSGMSWSKQPQSYPALVDRFREYIEALGREYTVIVGIDELDKLGSAATAENFLNDIKGIFGIRGCYFLVSVSEEAAASFHRRGVPYRDVFDSCFDDIVHADYLDHESAQNLLYERVTDIPLPFVGLCYALSGGLARDLIRTARSLVECAGEEIDVSTAAEALCRIEAISKTRGIQYELSLISGNPAIADLLSHVANMTRGATSATQYLEWSEVVSRWVTRVAKVAAREAEGVGGNCTSAVRLAAELSAFYLFLATVLEFFGGILGGIKMQSVEEYGKYVEYLDLLASVRQSLAVNPRISVSRVESIRSAQHP